jgi:hypothetical protein
MKSALGVMLMLLLANLGFVSANLPCATPLHSEMPMAGMTHASPVGGNMADMGQSRDTGRPCETAATAPCCQSLPASAAEMATAPLALSSEQQLMAPTLAELTRLVAPETPPPKA